MPGSWLLDSADGSACSVGSSTAGASAPSGGAPSNSSVISISSCSPPVQRTVSSPSGVTWSKATAPSRNSSSSERNRATVVRVSGRVAAQRPERHRARAAQPVHDDRGLLAHAHPRRRGCAAATPRAPAWAPAPGRPARRTARGRSRSAPPAAASRTAPRARPARAKRRDSPASRVSRTPATCLNARYCMQPGEEQVARLEQREVLLVLDVALRQQPGRLEVEQGRGDEQERRGLLEVPGLAADLDEGDELVGDLRQRDLGDVELVLGDQAQQQVEGALEVGQVQLEARRGGRLPAGRRSERRGSSRGRSSGVTRALSRRTSALSSPCSSKSASTSATASRTSRPRSTARPCARRSESRACSRSSSSSEVT